MKILDLGGEKDQKEEDVLMISDDSNEVMINGCHVDEKITQKKRKIQGRFQIRSSPAS